VHIEKASVVRTICVLLAASVVLPLAAQDHLYPGGVSPYYGQGVPVDPAGTSGSGFPDAGDAEGTASPYQIPGQGVGGRDTYPPVGGAYAGASGPPSGLSAAEAFFLFQEVISKPVNSFDPASVGDDRTGRVNSIASAGVDYDRNGRVTRFAGEEVAYDTGGNIIRFGGKIVHRDSTGRPVMIGDERISYDRGGRMTHIGPGRIDYDHAGRISRVGDKAVSYDLQGRWSRYGDAHIRYQE